MAGKVWREAQQKADANGGKKKERKMEKNEMGKEKEETPGIHTRDEKRTARKDDREKVKN